MRERGLGYHLILLLVYKMGRMINWPPNFPSHLKSGKENWAVAQYFNLFIKWEKRSSSRFILPFIQKVRRKIGQSPNIPARLKSGKEDQVIAQYSHSFKKWGGSSHPSIVTTLALGLQTCVSNVQMGHASPF
jgi:hypothetical protein